MKPAPGALAGIRIIEVDAIGPMPLAVFTAGHLVSSGSVAVRTSVRTEVSGQGSIISTAGLTVYPAPGSPGESNFTDVIFRGSQPS